MKMLEMIDGQARGLSGSHNYVDQNIQAVHELLGIPYQLQDEMELDQFLSSSKFGLVAVKFNNGAICFGFINYDAYIPTQKILDEVSKMAGVTRVAYFGKDGKQRWAGRI